VLPVLERLPSSSAAEPAEHPAPPGEGWELRFVTDARRAEEHRELYDSLGYEVALVGLDPSTFGPGCDACAASCDQVTVYTRRSNE
jgi:hypothetical protein